MKENIIKFEKEKSALEVSPEGTSSIDEIRSIDEVSKENREFDEDRPKI